MPRPVVGSSVLAKQAFLAYQMGTHHDDPWEVMGHGYTRVAMLHKPTSVIYKVEHNMDDDYSSQVEFENVCRLAAMCYPDQWWATVVRIPKAHLFEFEGTRVLAMQYIEGRQDSWLTPLQQRELNSVGVSDMHYENYIIDNNEVVWPIDFGSMWYDRRNY